MPIWIYRAILLSLMLAVIIVIAPHPLATNDGPVHLAFANLMATMHEPNHPLQQRVYSINLRPTSNLAVYLLLDALIRATSPDVAESMVQILSIIGPIAGCYFALLMINPRNAWLAVFLLPLSLNQMLFLGLYNHCISTAMFFLTIGCYYWMIKAPSVIRAALLSASLVLTFLFHASGFIAAFAGIGAMSATFFLFSIFRQRGVLRALRDQRYALGAMLGPLPIVYLFLSAAAKSNPASYEVSFLSRIKQFGTLGVLAPNLERDVYVAAALSAILLLTFSVGVMRILRKRGLPARLRDEAIATMVAALVSILVMMAFPDHMGGGWTHFRRFEFFPIFWGLLILAFESFSIPAAIALIAAAVSSGIILLGSTASRQSLIREQMRPLSDVNRIVGDHCTVLPVVFEARPLDTHGNPVWLTYHPYFQSASRLELTGDRVVLFNFLARLDAYPVHFRPNFEPQAHIFHWKPEQEQSRIDAIDVDGFENASGMQIDYILLWGDAARIPDEQRSQVLHALANFSEVYESPNGSVSLYSRRQNSRSSLCVGSGSRPGPVLPGR